MLRKVTLYGELAKKFGKNHLFDVNNPAEAVRALTCNFKDFPNAILLHKEGYNVVIDDGVIEEEQFYNPVQKEIKIIPVIAGSKRGGLGSIILGVALIGLSFYSPLAVPFSGVAGTTSWATIAFGVGSSLALGGVAQLLTPTPKTNAASSKEDVKRPSFYFNGPENTTRQGVPMPVMYGELIIGSVVGSSGLSTDDFVVAAANVDSTGALAGGTKNDDSTNNTQSYTQPTKGETQSDPSLSGKFGNG